MSKFVLLPEAAVRAALGASVERLRVLRPPYPALGLGELRALRLQTIGEAAGGEIRYELTAGYDRYESLVPPRRRAS